MPHRRETERHATGVHAGGTPALPGGVHPPSLLLLKGARDSLLGRSHADAAEPSRLVAHRRPSCSFVDHFFFFCCFKQAPPPGRLLPPGPCPPPRARRRSAGLPALPRCRPGGPLSIESQGYRLSHLQRLFLSRRQGVHGADGDLPEQPRPQRRRHPPAIRTEDQVESRGSSAVTVSTNPPMADRPMLQG